MSAREEILKFLADPSAFATETADGEIWLQGLTEHVEPLLSKAGQPLRSAQLDAWSGLASARAGLVLGPPGTGKTHLLAWLIVGYVLARRAAGLSARVFVSAFTRNAIGNLLDGVAERGSSATEGLFKTHYLGAAPPAGLSPSIQHRPSLARGEGEAALQDLSADAVVVGGSVWQLHRLLSHPSAPGDRLTAQLFDLICIDEASQMVLGQGLMALAGLRAGGRVVVAGDDKQLPPIRAGRDVTVNGRQLGGSLYSFLKSAGVPEFALEETFRLNGPLTTFPEKTFYSGRYRSADAVKQDRLRLQAGWQEGLEPWEALVLDPDWPVAVLVHDGPPAASKNPFESWVTARLLHRLADRIEGGRNSAGDYTENLWRERIAAVSPHRAQNAAIRSDLPAALKPGAFVETVDRIQGKERDAIILSYCVADGEFALAEADFIFAPERLNVAVTRARHKLIVLISKRLLNAVPPTQEQMDKAELLREFVFDAELKAELQITDAAGSPVTVQVRLAGFEDSRDLLVDLPRPEETPRSASAELTPGDHHLLEAVRREALASTYGTAASFRLQQLLGVDTVLPGLSRLQAHGLVDLRHQPSQHGGFWSARPIDPPRRVFPSDYETVRTRAEEAINQSRRGRKAPLYDEVRRLFGWINEAGTDILRPAVERLRDEGLVSLHLDDGKLRLDWIGEETDQFEPPPPEPELSDWDFEVLNALEDLEAKRINFGVLEAWTSAATLADAQKWSRSKVVAALGRLSLAGWVLLAGEGRVRSRMAELAREVRYVKQRFRRDDADKRPYLVRSLKVELRDRDKPARTEPVAHVFAGLKASACAGHARALSRLEQSLLKTWGADARMAGFQRRSLEALTAAWAAKEANAYVISADTGSGKTEAAVLPLIAGAAADRLRGVKGVRAVLAYPRIRLAANQAQRLVGYLSLLAAEDPKATITLGMQFKLTPTRLDALQSWDTEAGWRDLGGGHFAFPLFGCPGCGADLQLTHAAGFEGADRLACVACGWTFEGWIGSKAAIRERPPALYISTTDSLHQWMHDPNAGRLFGDDPAYEPPRALLADEIHLYSHVHGAQVALAFQRLAARAAVNRPDSPPMLMVGMSATLGDPARAWGRLAGRRDVTAISVNPDERLPNPRGREYFYFVQPEVESRGSDVAGASTTIQSLMCLAHGMRRRTGSEGGYRGIVFLDSIDKVRRLHGDFSDAEEGQNLAAYRTRLYPEDPSTGELPKECCREPHGCDRFKDGECWVFAATDTAQVCANGPLRIGRPLSVIDRPVSAASTGRVEDTIKRSDLVFATSSLEVGYDDPDITLVYQHYAPQNLASFIQRKGRGGRGADDRPLTAVTLSIYSSRDSWWFSRPHLMLDPSGFDTPLNPDNYFVRRGQILATVLDAFARHQRRREAFDLLSPGPGPLAEAEALVTEVFGGPAWTAYAPTLAEFWRKATARTQPAPTLPKLREGLDWCPTLLFDTINLPRLTVRSRESDNIQTEDISLAFSSIAPGNATRRYDFVQVLWRPPVDGQAPWLAPEDYASASRPEPFGSTSDGWLQRLPTEARSLLEGLSPSYIRPRTITLERLGRMHGATWISEYHLDDQGILTHGPGPEPRQVSHQSHGHLRGFPIIKPDEDLGRAQSIEGLAPWVEQLHAFLGDGLGGPKTGLALARVFWGADAELIVRGPPREVGTMSQVFTAPGQGPTLHGYHVQTEGLRFTLNSAHLDGFVAQQLSRLEADAAEQKWFAAQMVRWHVEAGAQALGLNMFQMRRAAELIVSGLAVPNYLERLRRIAFLWSGADIADLFEEIRSDLLSCHPLLSAERVKKVAAAFSDDRVQSVLASALGLLEHPTALATWLRSSLLHGLALRLKDSFVHVGHGEERQVIAHALLPLQFGSEACDAITICEVGHHGDGTTRAYLERQALAAGHWRDGYISGCPSAAEDRALGRLMAQADMHAAWRSLDPHDPSALSTLSGGLGLAAGSPLPAAALRILYGTEAVGSERFDLFDLAQVIRAHDLALQARLGREPSAWELTSAVVEDAKANADTVTGRLLAAYGGVEDAVQEEALSAEGRLADQVYRISARLCVDGCQACVHRPSDLMSEGLMQASVSRRLLERFLCVSD